MGESVWFCVVVYFSMCVCVSYVVFLELVCVCDMQFVSEPPTTKRDKQQQHETAFAEREEEDPSSVGVLYFVCLYTHFFKM
mmetsp:Transcript_12292/g.16174  ORF Transcript_12292/g.16174 Transcript_12292/m.16174 type:complete len:81 (+) Transcript_12292:110-352(+)